MTPMKSTLMIALFSLAGCSGAEPDAEDQPTPVALVSMAPAVPGDLQQTLTLYGAVQKDSASQYSLSAPMEAMVVDVAAPVGTTVRAGQLIVRLRPSPNSQASIAKNASDARAAQQALARAIRLRGDGLVSDADVETARAAAAAAAAQQAASMAQTRGLGLYARATGHVEAIPVNRGDLVTAGTTIATLSQGGAVRASFGISPQAARQVPVGTPIRIGAASGGPLYPATILSINPTVDPQSRLASLYVALPAATGFTPGQPLSASLPLAGTAHGVIIPYAALLDDGGQPYVYVVQGGVAHRHDVTTGPADGDRIVIVKGVAAGDRVVTAGVTGLEDGMKVRVK